MGHLRNDCTPLSCLARLVLNKCQQSDSVPWLQAPHITIRASGVPLYEEADRVQQVAYQAGLVYVTAQAVTLQFCPAANR